MTEGAMGIQSIILHEAHVFLIYSLEHILPAIEAETLKSFMQRGITTL